ncbi:MAG: hypothetical protein ABIF82_13300 [Planctomycetota bacterium]
MAIEKVKRTWFLVERGELNALIRGLADSRTVHVVDLKEETKGQAGSADRPAPDHNPDRNLNPPPDLTPALDAAESNVGKLSRALDVLDGFAPPKRRFHENFVNLPAEMKRDEFERHVAEVNVAELAENTAAIQRDHAAAEKRAEELSARIAQLADWADATVPPAGLSHCRCDLGVMPAKALPKLEQALCGSGVPPVDDHGQDGRATKAIAVNVVAVSGGRALVAAVWLNEAEDEAEDLLHGQGFESLGLDASSGKVAAVIQNCDTALVTVEAKLAILGKKAAKLAENRRAVLAALAHWQAEVERHGASAKALASKRIATLSGYVLVREMPKLEELLAKEFPSVSLIAEDPTAAENVPVSLGGSKLWAPAQFLTSMFGLPNYFEFDPSPFIFLTFLIFFGFCFGDVVYGLMLLATGWWLARKSADYPSLARFFGLLTWCGLASIIVGVITGSWAADLISGGYLGKGAEGFVTNLMIVDPLKKTVVVLGVVLGIGMLNQFYGMTLLLYREWRKGNRLAGLCDGGLWLIFLPGLVLLLAGAMGALPPVWTKVALGMAAASGLGLILTQGRNEQTFLAKAITGVVSLYGILGTYGTTSFIGDTLSYSRLLALGLTTVIVGMSFNIIANLAMSIPVAGVIFFIVVVAFGHMFNFFISILGGFVHSARLIFVEFFTKFYEGGAAPFAPLGAPRTVRVTEEN